MTPPLCIIQARMGSTRLPGKMLLKLDGMTLIERAWRTACEAFGRDNVVVAHPDTPENQILASHVDAMLAQRFAFSGDEADVLGRFWACAHAYRWQADAVIVRYTPDDPFKTADGLRRVADGERLPVEHGGEAFYLGTLDDAQETIPALKSDAPRWAVEQREHISLALFPVPAPPAPKNGTVWTIDSQEQYDAACKSLTQPRRNRGKESISSPREVEGRLQGQSSLDR